MKKPALLALVLTAVACGGEGSEPSYFTVTDSAGVEVVETAVPVWEEGGAWTVATEPDLRIGLLEGEAPYLFSGISSVLQLADGTIVVGDDQSREIRFFRPDGSFSHAVGRDGDGPGEYSDIAWVAQCGEGLFVLSRYQRRVTTLTLDGDMIGTKTLTTPGSDWVPYRSRCGSDGSFIVVGWGDRPEMRPDVTFDYFTQMAPVWWMSSPESDPVRLGEYVSSERVLTFDPSTGGGGSAPHPFSRSVVLAVGESLYIGSAERLQLEERDRSGALLRLMRGPDDDLVVDEEFLDQYRRADLGVRESEMRDLLAEEEMPMPPRYPAYSEIVLDPLDNIWLERFQLAWDEQVRWGVFSGEGRFLGHVSLPNGFQLMQVTESRVLGVRRDELGIERVEVYALRRGN